MSEEDAIEKAIPHMRDPGLIGKQFDKTHKAKFEWGIIIPLLCFSLFGLFTMYFILSKVAVSEADYIKMFQKNLVFYILGIVLMIGLYFFDYRRVLPYSKSISIASLIILILQLFCTIPVNGVYYFHLGPVIVNLVPYALILLILSLAVVLQSWKWNNPNAFLKALGIIVLSGLLIFISNGAFVFLYFITCITVSL